MSKRLLALVLIALTVCFVSAAYAEVQNVKVGGDLTVIGVSRDNLNLQKDSFVNPAGPADEQKGVAATGVASIARVRVDANLTDNVDVTFRILNERIWSTGSETGDSTTGMDLDLAFVSFKDFLKDVIGVPLTVKLGRQEMKLGSGLLIGDPDTNQAAKGGFQNAVGFADLSSRKAFDGALAVLDLNPLTITGAAVKVTEGNVLLSQDDVNAYALNAAYNLGVMNTTAELTYVLETRNKEAAAVVADRQGDINNYGVRITSMPVENLGVEAEYVYQTQKDGTKRTDLKPVSDYALRLGANYTLANVAMTPSFGIDYTRLSENWNVMFEDLTPADIMNLIFPNSNVQLIGATFGLKPTQDLTAKLRYAYARLVEQNMGATFTSPGTGFTYNLNGEKKNLGQELDLDLAYDYTSDVQFGLNLGYFKPGKAFTRDFRGAASQVVGSMKVSF